MAEEGIRSEERLPLPIDAVKQWCARMPVGVSYERWIRDAAIITLGMRLMRRPGEIAALRCSDVSFDTEGWAWILLRKSKTDQLAVGRKMPLEPSGNVTCPVKWLREWLAVYGGMGEAPLFPSLESRDLMSSATVSSVVIFVAAKVGLVGRYTGHSLRIGGATAAMKGGMTMAMIRAIGGWESKAVLLYLRSVGTAKAGASSLMGL